MTSSLCLVLGLGGSNGQVRIASFTSFKTLNKNELIECLVLQKICSMSDPHQCEPNTNIDWPMVQDQDHLCTIYARSLLQKLESGYMCNKLHIQKATFGI